MSNSHDVVVVGGGPGGLSAALVFGRARKTALVVDAGSPRNARAHAVNNFLTRDGTPPRELRAEGRRQLDKYDAIEVREGRVDRIEQDGRGFRVTLAAGDVVTARRVLLATGVVDVPPDLPGLDAVWGHSAFQCPFCHGWEVRDRAWCVLVPDAPYVDYAIMMRGWTRDVVALTNGATLDAASLDKLGRAGIRVVTQPIEKLVADGEQLTGIDVDGGLRVPCDALLLRPAQRQVALVTALGLALDDLGFVKVDEHRQSSVPGIHVAGDAMTMKQTALGAAYEGQMAAVGIVHALTVDSVLGDTHG